ncbi:hypothetical protein AHAS_Ahas12G0206000 [Arachis hypogaea]
MALIPDTTQGRSFFLEVSSEMDMGELPSNFYRRFHDELASLLTFADCAGNELQVLIEKGPRTGIIVNGFRNFSSFYGLKLGGWLKVSYVGSNHFIINEVIDHNMKVKEFSSPPFKVSLDIKPTVGFDSVIDISKESSLLSSVHVKDLSYKSPQPYSINESFYTVNSTNLLPSDNNNSVVPLDICLQLQSTPQILNTTHVPSFANDNFFDRAHYSNIPTQFHQEPLHFPFIHNEKQSNFSLDLYKTRCHSVMRTHPLSHDDYSFAIGNDISNSVSDFVLAHNPNPPNEFPLPPPPLPSSIVSPVVYSIVKVLSPFQSKHYAMLLPARFAVRAFSRKLDFVNVIQLTGPSIRMKLRWRDIRPNEDLDVSSDQQNWRIKVRVIKIWSLSAVEDKYRKPMLEFIVMDQLEPHRRLFENHIIDGSLYSISNFSLAINDQKYKPTTHSLRIYFKRETQLRRVEDINFPTNMFHFVPNELILSQQNPQSHLIDVMGLITAKGDIVEFSKNGKKSIYIVVELDDMQGKGTIRCTLWEEFATQLVQHIQDNPTTEYILIIQFAKFNLFKSAMGISNTNYNSLLYINPDFKEVKDFRQSFIMCNDQPRNALTQIPSHTAYSMEDDLLNRTPYKPICEIKELTDGGFYCTIGTVISVENKNGWWYKGCKLCYRALKEDESFYYCMFCYSFPNIHVPRFCVQVRVCDDTDNAAFVIYDKEASRYLGTSASDLRASQLSKGSSKDDIPDEINSFKGKKFLFKISVKLDDINAFQPCKITVLKLCEDLQLITLFASKYKIYDENMPLENSEIQSAQSEFDVTPINNSSQSCEIINLDSTQDIVTPKRSITSLECSKNLSEVFSDLDNSSCSKSRRITKEPTISVGKEHVD